MPKTQSSPGQHHRPRLTVAALTMLSCTIAAVGSIVMLFWHMSDDRGIGEAVLSGTLFGLWNAGPFLGLLALAFAFRASRLAELLILSGVVALSIYGGWAIYQTHVYPDAQGALVFLFLPIYQWGGVLVFGVLAKAVHLISRATRSKQVHKKSPLV